MNSIPDSPGVNESEQSNSVPVPEGDARRLWLTLPNQSLEGFQTMLGQRWSAWEAALRQLPKEHTEEWGQTTTAGIIAGMLYGGAREAASSQGEFLRHFRASPARASQRELMEQRLVRIVQGTVRGGWQLGLIAALFSGAQLAFSATLRDGRKDKWCTAGAGAVTGAAVGLVGRGTLMSRASTAVSFAALGATIALPLGLLQETLQSMLPHTPPPNEPQPEDVFNSAEEQLATAIARLEQRWGVPRERTEEDKEGQGG